MPAQLNYSEMIQQLGFANVAGADRFNDARELRMFVRKDVLDAQWDGDCGYSESEIERLAEWMLGRGDEFVAGGV